LLSIYDSLASENNLNSVDGSQSEDRNGSHGTILSNKEHPIAIQVISNECDTTDSDSIMEAEGQGKTSSPERSDLDPSECKKRPLSVGSGSSSSSSVSHHIIKKPNLTSTDSNSSKLEHILYIDDENGDQSINEEKSDITSVPDISVTDVSSSEVLEETRNTCQFVISPNQSHGVFIEHGKGPKSTDSSPQPDTMPAPDTQGVENSPPVSVSQNSLVLPSCHSSSSLVSSECSSIVSVDTRSPMSATSQTTPTNQPKSPDSPTKYVTRVQRVIAEIVDTERTYVSSLNEIIQVCE
jgi:hypothetical protein